MRKPMNPLPASDGLNNAMSANNVIPVNRALVVDDNWYNRDIFRIALKDAGYEVSELEDGSHGLDTLDQQTFALMILDLQMPTVDGLTLLRQIRQTGKYAPMRIVVVTANAHMATTEVYKLADYVMLKPISVLDFSAFVRRLM